MDLQQALLAAQQEGDSFVGDPTVPCPFLKTGLLVLVYRDDDKREVLAGVEVELAGTSQKADGTTAAVSGKKGTTGGDGMVRAFKPFDPGSYTVKVTKLTDPDKLYEKPYPQREQGVSLGTCPVCDIGVRVLARPEIEVVWKQDGKAVSGVKVELKGAKTYAFAKATDGSGVTKWPDSEDPIEPGAYTCSLTLPKDADKYQIFDEKDKAAGNPPSLAVPSGRQRFKFKVQEVSWVKFRVVQQVSPSQVVDVVGAEVTAKLPDGTTPAALPTSQSGSEWLAEIKNVPIGNGSPAKCELQAVAAPEALEFVALTPP